AHQWQQFIELDLLTQQDDGYHITEHSTYIMQEYQQLTTHEFAQLAYLPDEQMQHLYNLITRIVQTAMNTQNSPKAGLHARQQSAFRYSDTHDNWLIRLQNPFLDLVAYRNDCSHNRWQSTALSALQGEILGYIASGYRTSVADFDPTGFIGHNTATYHETIKALKHADLIIADAQKTNHFIATQAGEHLIMDVNKIDHAWFLEAWSTLPTEDEKTLFHLLDQLQTCFHTIS
ncbi:MAG: hypothetical protein AAFQ07_21250, partial [Chloroflexota bacterium]